MQCSTPFAPLVPTGHAATCPCAGDRDRWHNAVAHPCHQTRASTHCSTPPGILRVPGRVSWISAHSRRYQARLGPVLSSLHCSPSFDVFAWQFRDTRHLPRDTRRLDARLCRAVVPRRTEKSTRMGSFLNVSCSYFRPPLACRARRGTKVSLLSSSHMVLIWSHAVSRCAESLSFSLGLQCSASSSALGASDHSTHYP